MTSAIIATTPAQMQEAGTLAAVWIERKLQEAGRELMLAHEVFGSLKGANLRTAPAAAQIKSAMRRVTFYEKVKAALAAGYHIIPPFRVEAFAIRVPAHSSPRRDRDDNHWNQQQKAAALPAGEGHFVAPAIGRSRVDTETRESSDGKTTREVAIYENDRDWLDVDLPLIAHKPQIIDAVAGALESLIFDALGIAPESRASDPIIVGQIRHWRANRLPLTFFVAWWLDERDL